MNHQQDEIENYFDAYRVMGRMIDESENKIVKDVVACSCAIMCKTHGKKTKLNKHNFLTFDVVSSLCGDLSLVTSFPSITIVSYMPEMSTIPMVVRDICRSVCLC